MSPEDTMHLSTQEEGVSKSTRYMFYLIQFYVFAVNQFTIHSEYDLKSFQPLFIVACSRNIIDFSFHYKLIYLHNNSA